MNFINYIPTPRGRIGRTFWAVVILLVCINTIFIASYRERQLTSWHVRHAQSVLFYTTQVQSKKLQVRQQAWSYVFLRDDYHLEEYSRTVRELNSSIKILSDATINDALQQERIEKLKLTIGNQLNFYKRMINLSQDAPYSARLSLIERGSNGFNKEIDEHLFDIRKQEDQALLQQIRAYAKSLRLNQIMLWLSLVGNWSALIGFVAAFSDYSNTLRQQVSDRTNQLNVKASELRAALDEKDVLNEQLQVLNEQLQVSIRETQKKASELRAALDEKETLNEQLQVSIRETQKKASELRAALDEKETLNEQLQVLNEQLQVSIRETQKALSTEQELNILKTQFINVVSHEYRTPLTVIYSSAELLSVYWDRFNETKRNTHFQSILAQVSFMIKLLEDVLIISKSDTGNIECNPESLDIRNFLEHLVETLNASDKGKHEINVSFITDCYTYHLDKILLRFILENLISNAIKYSPNGSTVSIEVEELQQEIHFRIQDKGIGIPEQDLDRLFDSFFRAENVGTVQGTGIGLAIVKRCVELHQGTIEVSSMVEVGTTFTVTFPITTGHGN